MIIVEIEVPSLQEKFDFQLDESAQVGNLLAEICEILCKKTKSEMDEEMSDYLLFNKKEQRILDMELTLTENGIVEGGRLLLV